MIVLKFILWLGGLGLIGTGLYYQFFSTEVLEDNTRQTVAMMIIGILAILASLMMKNRRRKSK